MKHNILNPTSKLGEDWTKYSWEDKESHPPCPGRYLIHRKKCGKTHFEQWNGSGWSSSNKDCTHWAIVLNPKD